MRCLKCGHVWISRVPKPILCPKCKSPDYHKEKVYEVQRRRKEDHPAIKEIETPTEKDKTEIKPREEIFFE